MDLALRGKTALVAAASRGLGKAVALRLAQEGARVVICARDAAAVSDAVSAVSKISEGGPALGLTVDLNKTEDIDRLGGRFP